MSEGVFQDKLNPPRTGSLHRLPELGAAGGRSSAPELRELGVVQQIVDVHANLDTLPFAELKAPDEAHIHIVDTRPRKDISPQIPDAGISRTCWVGTFRLDTNWTPYTPAVQFTTFAFPTTTASCKNGEWQNLVRSDGTSFKNQGECVSYVQTGQ